MGKWILEQVTSEGGEKFHELRCDGVLRMRLPAGCLHMGSDGDAAKMFLRVLNTDDPLAALKKYAKHAPQCSWVIRHTRCDCGYRAAFNDLLFVSAIAAVESGDGKLKDE